MVSGEWKRSVRYRTDSWCGTENQVFEKQRYFEPLVN
jgi:hypothetical protein